ncbi:MAG: hypothetical protein V4601_13870 [Pseudomonadota bacterium]
MLRFCFLIPAAFVFSGALPSLAQESLSNPQARKLTPSLVWPKGTDVTRLGAIQAGTRRFWVAHLFSPLPGETNDIHGQCRLVFLERIAQKWTYLGHYLVDCAPVRRKGNRIGYEYNDAYIYFTLDEKGPPAKLTMYDSYASHHVFIK